ncbi:hypothetical protein BCL57_000322 [Agromyces flavus]|uniref:Glycolipid-binding n=1 Tax=Agromyces flavus TaxID=589382 RepID=A0A1H1WHQ1_9MICO|nr:putative glycolipid-binding domain-containing protein [Agromyces flavus]MCP2366180.1 hypothetical protein [Agromyces flavus]GGI44160.1 hypothetical protein GCM10010932_03220 [Agromyces flavus]SDS96797.1 hypothetical protein SAMN04489721_2250 [Agromyces flavus]
MERTLFWRRIDEVGLERLELSVTEAGIEAVGTVLGLDAGGFRVEHRWSLAPDWRTRTLVVERSGAVGRVRLRIERDGDGWRVDDVRRPDLDGADEPDLSVTPFCNTLPIRRLPTRRGAASTLDTCWIDADEMAVVRSRQQYVRRGARAVRYIDLGAAAGFEADLEVDGDGLVVRYEHLFERVSPGPVTP